MLGSLPEQTAHDKAYLLVNGGYLAMAFSTPGATDQFDLVTFPTKLWCKDMTPLSLVDTESPTRVVLVSKALPSGFDVV